MQNKSNNNLNNEDNNSENENLLRIIKEQTADLKKKNKKLEKLEEIFIKTNTDLKNILADKTNIENFLKIIFPKEMHENIIKQEYGLYESNDLSKFWLVCESKNQTEFQKILQQIKLENSELIEKNKNLNNLLETKTEEFLNCVGELEKIKMEFDKDAQENLLGNLKELENEKIFLLSIVDDKNKEIENLKIVEIENAELKAKILLNSNSNNSNSRSYNNNSNFVNKKSIKEEKVEKEKEEKNAKKISILTLNSGTQTPEEIFSLGYVENLRKNVTEIKENFEKQKKEFNKHKERSHKIILENEENSIKISKENEELKQKVSEINQQIISIQNNQNSQKFPKKKNLEENKEEDNYELLNPQFKLSEINNHRISVEYLKNVLLKYLEAFAIGDEFQIKLLENVIFSILKVPEIEKIKLEEKRNRSSFYLNLWYNAKAFLNARIYGVYGEEGIINIEDNSNANDISDKENNKESAEMNSNDVNVNEIDLNENVNNSNKNFNSNFEVNKNESRKKENFNNNNIEYDDDDEIDIQF